MVGPCATELSELTLTVLERLSAAPRDAVDQAIAATLADIAAFASADAAYMIEITRDGGSFSVPHVWQYESARAPAWTEGRFPADDLAPHQRAGNACVIDDAAALADSDSLRRWLDRRDMAALLEQPILTDRGIAGSVALARSEPSRPWRPEERALVQAAAAAIGQALRRRRSDREREHLERRLQRGERLEAVGRLAAGVAHDFNNILLAIGSFAHLAEHGRHRPGAQRDAFCEIGRAVDRARNLTRQLLAFSSREPSDRRHVDLNEVVESLRMIIDRLVPSSIEVAIEAERPLAAVYADPGHLEQILVNLCVNARDAMPAGGTLTIRTRNATREGNGRDDCIELCVEDTGVGFGDDVRAHIFDPFFTTKGESEGTGLGLATVRGLIDNYRGEIDVSSNPGVGTCFRIRLPASDGPVSAHYQRAPSANGEPANVRGHVLLANAEPALLRSVSMVLEEGGHRVTTACDGAAAIEEIEGRGREFDLVVVDLVMPKASGVQVADAAHALHPRLPVLLTTGCGMRPVPGLAERARTAVLGKPFSSDQLLRLAGRLMAGDRDEHA